MAVTATIRPLTRQSDTGAVRDLYGRAADYIRLETGQNPDDGTVTEFFDDVPPGADIGQSLKLGLFVAPGRLLAIADMGFGFPDPQDAYIGLMLCDAAARGKGLGRHLLDHLVTAARARHAPRLFVAVLDANPRGRAFWEREGFRVVKTVQPAADDPQPHIRHRMERRL